MQVSMYHETQVPKTYLHIYEYILLFMPINVTVSTLTF